MAQHDYIIDNQTSASLRADLNNALAAIVSQNSGATAPSTTYPNQFWYDTTNDQLKQRNESNSLWITLGTVDQTNNKFEPNQTFATQAEATAGTDNTKAMTALRTAQAIGNLSPYPYKNVQLFTASGTWTVPAGVTQAFVLCNGGGGGGGAGNSASNRGGNGGIGGSGSNLLTVSGSVTVTIGAGGAGSNTDNVSGSAGGTTSFSTISTTGGTGGIFGTSGGNGANGTNGTVSGGTGGALTTFSTYAIPTADIMTGLIDSGVVLRPNATSSTAAIAYSLGGGFRAGSGGIGETSGTAANATGGVGGSVWIFW